MTKVAFIADCHVGNHRRFGGPVQAGINQRCQMTLDALERAYALAGESGADLMVVLGDLYDTARPEPQIVAAVQAIMGDAPIPTYILLGNHDMVSDASGDHALGPLAPVDKVTVVDRPHVVTVGPGSGPKAPKVDLLLVPFRPGPAKVWLPEDVKALSEAKTHGRHRVLGLHLGIEADDTPPFLRNAHDSVKAEQLWRLMEEYDIETAAAGNWHSRRLLESFDGQLMRNRHILQCGTLCPTGWDNPGMEGYGTVAIYDTKTFDFDIHEVPGPRFIAQRDRDSFAENVKEPSDGWRVFLRRSVADPDQLGPAAKLMDEAVTRGLFAGGEVEMDDSAAKETARGAARAARSAETLSEAVVAYVGGLDANDEDRAWVLSYVLTALGAAGA